MTEPADLLLLPELALLPRGATFGSYVIHECIGQGAMGSVYRAEHALLKKPVALKLMGSSLLDSLDARQRFLREGQAAAAIKHPNVVDITDVGVHEGTPYLVMELLEGEELQSYLEKHTHLDDHEVAELMLPIVAALGAAHDRGVVHRDLKPGNIFLARGADGDVVPKVLDFGISKVASGVAITDFESTPFNQLMGSPLYLPPEAVHGGQNLTTKSDQYSLGVILYECVTGQPPFKVDSLLSLLNAIFTGDFPRPGQIRPSVSQAMERTVLRTMSADPSLRFDHVRDVGAALLDMASLRTQVLWGRSFGRRELSEPSSLRATLAFGPAPEPPGLRRRRKHGLVMISAAALVAFVAFLLPSSRASREPQVHLSGTSSSLRGSTPTPAQGERANEPVPLAEPPALLVAESPTIDRDRKEAPRRASAPADERVARPLTDSPRPAARAPQRAPVEPIPERSAPRVALLVPAVRLLPPHEETDLLPLAEHDADDVRGLFFPPASPTPAVPRAGPSSIVAGVNDAPILD